MPGHDDSSPPAGLTNDDLQDQQHLSRPAPPEGGQAAPPSEERAAQPEGEPAAQPESEIAALMLEELDE